MTLMSKIEGLCTKSLHPNLEACLDNWMTIIQEVDAVRNATQRQQGQSSSPTPASSEEGMRC